MRRGETLRLAAAAALAAVLVAGCRSHDAGPGPPGRSSGDRSEGMSGISLQNFREADTRWVLQADSASVFRARKRVEAEWVAIDFYEGEKHVSKLTADRGILLQATDDLEARGNVRVVTDDGAVLETEVLFWDHQRSRIHTDQYVEITKGEDVLTGVGLEADPGLDRIDLKTEVKGTVRSDPARLVSDPESPSG